MGDRERARYYDDDEIAKEIIRIAFYQNTIVLPYRIHLFYF